MMCNKKHVELRNSMVPSDKSFELNQNETQNLKISQFGQFLAHSDML